MMHRLTIAKRACSKCLDVIMLLTFVGGETTGFLAFLSKFVTTCWNEWTALHNQLVLAQLHMQVDVVCRQFLFEQDHARFQDELRGGRRAGFYTLNEVPRYCADSIHEPG